MTLHHILYLSRATQRMTTEDLEDIRRVSNLYNHENGITGVLFYSAGQFVQLLEGEKSEVHRLLERIRRDPRHEDLRVLVDRSTDRRLFKHWEMGLLDLDLHDEEDRQRLETLVAIAGQNETDAQGTPVEMVILSQFCMLLPMP